MNINDEKHRDMVNAIAAGDLWHVEALIKSGLNLDHTPWENAGFYLKLSAGMQDHGNEVMRMLLSAGADPNIRLSSEASSALSIATVKGNVEAVRILLDVGADVHQLMEADNTIMHKAVHSSIEIIDLLASHGASANTPNAIGFRPFDFLIKSWAGDPDKWNESVAKRLVALGAEFSPAVFDGFKPEDAEYLRINISQYRLEHKAKNLSLTDKNRRTIRL